MKNNTIINADDTKLKSLVEHSSGSVGGLLVGKRHSEGGIKAFNKSTGQPLEMEGGEVVITRDAVTDNKKRSFNGKMMTNREILSAINQSGGGISFADGGEVPNDLSFDMDAQFEYGGETMCGCDIAKRMAKGGGLSKGKSLLEIAKLHNLSLIKLTKEFKKGIQVESEHTSDKNLREKIAKDHLVENPNYYTILEKSGLALGGLDDVAIVSPLSNTESRYAQGGIIDASIGSGSERFFNKSANNVEYVTIQDSLKNDVKCLSFTELKEAVADVTYAYSRKITFYLSDGTSLYTFIKFNSDKRNTTKNLNPKTFTKENFLNVLNNYFYSRITFNIYDWINADANSTTITSKPKSTPKSNKSGIIDDTTDNGKWERFFDTNFNNVSYLEFKNDANDDIKCFSFDSFKEEVSKFNGYRYKYITIALNNGIQYDVIFYFDDSKKNTNNNLNQKTFTKENFLNFMNRNFVRSQNFNFYDWINSNVASVSTPTSTPTTTTAVTITSNTNGGEWARLLNPNAITFLSYVEIIAYDEKFQTFDELKNYVSNNLSLFKDNKLRISFNFYDGGVIDTSALTGSYTYIYWSDAVDMSKNTDFLDPKKFEREDFLNACLYLFQGYADDFNFLDWINNIPLIVSPIVSSTATSTLDVKSAIDKSFKEFRNEFIIGVPNSNLLESITDNIQNSVLILNKPNIKFISLTNWQTDKQLNLYSFKEFHQYLLTIPLKKGETENIKFSFVSENYDMIVNVELLISQLMNINYDKLYQSSLGILNAIQSDVSFAEFLVILITNNTKDVVNEIINYSLIDWFFKEAVRSISTNSDDFKKLLDDKSERVLTNIEIKSTVCTTFEEFKKLVTDEPDLFDGRDYGSTTRIYFSFKNGEEIGNGSERLLIKWLDVTIMGKDNNTLNPKTFTKEDFLNVCLFLLKSYDYTFNFLDFIKPFMIGINDESKKYIADSSSFINPIGFSKEQDDISALKKLLPSFQGSRFAIERARILKELARLHKIVTDGFIKSNEELEKDSNLFSPQGLLQYYYTQTTQNPTAELEPACKLPTPNGEESKLPLSAYLNVRTPQFRNWFGDWEMAYVTNNYTNCSKMIDEETKEPKIFYHGVRKYVAGFGQFSNMGQGVIRPYGTFEPPSFPASYFSDKENYAKFYGGIAENMPTPSPDYKPFIYKVFLSVKNPISLLPLDFDLSYRDLLDYLAVAYGVKIEPNKTLLSQLNGDMDKKHPMWIYIRRDIGLIEKLKDYGYDALFQIGDIPVFLENGEVESDRSKYIQESEFLTFYPNQVKSATVKRSFYFDFFNDIRFKKGGYVRI